MSRILEALKKAVPRPRNDAPAAPKPLIFEKISFDAPNPETIRKEVEAKKESARLRYLLNERAPRPEFAEESRHLIWVLTALVAAGVAAVLLWPRSAVSPKETVSPAAFEQRVADLEAQLEAKDAEIDRLRKEARVSEEPEVSGELESLRDDVRKLNRRLAVMLQDNLEKDQELSRLRNS